MNTISVGNIFASLHKDSCENSICDLIGEIRQSWIDVEFGVPRGELVRFYCYYCVYNYAMLLRLLDNFTVFVCRFKLVSE